MVLVDKKNFSQLFTVINVEQYDERIVISIDLIRKAGITKV